jgi:hypothetical protein
MLNVDNKTTTTMYIVGVWNVDKIFEILLKITIHSSSGKQIGMFVICLIKVNKIWII